MCRSKTLTRVSLIFLCSTILTLANCKCKPEQPAPEPAPKSAQAPDVVDFPNAFSWTQTYDVATQTLLVRVALKDGYHAYAPGEKVGRPVELVVAGDKGWKLESAPLLPKGETKVVGEIGPTQVLEKSFEISAKVTRGTGPLVGTLKMQLCTDHACDRPRDHAFSVDVPQ
jgi:hypothetical protein